MQSGTHLLVNGRVCLGSIEGMGGVYSVACWGSQGCATISTSIHLKEEFIRCV